LGEEAGIRAPSVSGYLHRDYAVALAEQCEPLELPNSGGWLLRRAVPGDHGFDAAGCYPLFACRDWQHLEADLLRLDGNVVTVALVADPFGDHDLELLTRCFPDVHVPFKEHFVTDLEWRTADVITGHHKRNVRYAQTQVDVEVVPRPREHLQAWVELYANLTGRHLIGGAAAFSPHSFSLQMSVPGLVVFRAVRRDETVGMTLWFLQGDVAYYHLGAYSEAGYSARASFALFAAALEHFRGQARWLALGAGAGITNSADDGLSRFKRGWATGTRTAYLCGRVCDPARYARLTGSTARRTKFFPAYRAPEDTSRSRRAADLGRA
jgi:hypothetical protein